MVIGRILCCSCQPKTSDLFSYALRMKLFTARVKFQIVHSVLLHWTILIVEKLFLEWLNEDCPVCAMESWCSWCCWVLLGMRMCAFLPQGGCMAAFCRGSHHRLCRQKRCAKMRIPSLTRSPRVRPKFTDFEICFWVGPVKIQILHLVFYTNLKVCAYMFFLFLWLP